MVAKGPLIMFAMQHQLGAFSVSNDKCCSILGIGEGDTFTRKIYALLLGREHFLCLLFLNYLHFKIILMPK